MDGFKSTVNSMTGGQLPMFAEEPACAKYCPNLSFKHRLIGFAGCAGLGVLLSFMGTMTLVGGPTQTNVRTFIILYVFGNVIALCSTGFLLGPRSQCRQMFHPTRRYSTCFYLAMLIIVFSVAVAKQHIALVIILLLIQIVAGFWYAISYIPFARKMVGAGLRRTQMCVPCFYVYDGVQESMKNMQTQTGSSNAGGSTLMTKKGFTFLQEEA